ncbi:MAG: glycosyltransferase [Nitrososphaeria archaeon]|nr:glycosyltransferase [Conexivisphaerales archaeon]
MDLIVVALYAASTAFILYFTLRPYLFSVIQFFKKYRFKGLKLVRVPKVLVIIPAYNEESTIERVLRGVLSFDYPNFEVIVADDSTDGTTQKILAFKDPRLKVVHRNDRKGWKAGAVNNALNYADPSSEYTVILDADSIPPQDLLTKLVERIQEGYDAVQGVQLPVINSDYNRIAKANSIIQSYYQLVEQPSKFYIGLPVTLTGSNFIIKTDLLKKYRLNEDIGEDWELTLRLARDGHRIAYAPDIAVKCEVPFNLKDSINQYVRWNEGMVRSTLRKVSDIMQSDMPFASKADLVMTGLTPFITYALIISMITGAYLYFSQPGFRPMIIFLTAFIMLSGIVTMISSASKIGLSYFYALFSELLYFIFVPFAVYASLRGMVLREGTFIRTTKIGEIN